ncbi:hypothetical protein JYQ62_32345 [Nostoc sp. UHCC 0702]|nr:hypothetical protein JYQ62_32345 [Nostoc sp. UHCC 0702]
MTTAKILSPILRSMSRVSERQNNSLTNGLLNFAIIPNPTCLSLEFPNIKEYAQGW